MIPTTTGEERGRSETENHVVLEVNREVVVVHLHETKNENMVEADTIREVEVKKDDDKAEKDTEKQKAVDETRDTVVRGCY